VVGAQAGSRSADSEIGTPMRWLLLFATILIFLQLVLGATMRHQHAGLAIPDFPLAYGKLWPAMDVDSIAGYNARRIETTAANPITAFQVGLQMAHRLMALAILICVGAVAWSARRWSARFSVSDGGNNLKVGLQRLAFGWLGLILVQAGLGAWTIWSNKAADVATAHVLAGALSLVTGTLGCIIAFHRSSGVVEANASAASPFGAERREPFPSNPATALIQ
jgi:cytochrome c oxidase assembly protein subunit 15